MTACFPISVFTRRRWRGTLWARSTKNVKNLKHDVIVMDMGYDDSNNDFSKNLGIFNYFLYTVQKIEFEGRFLYKITHAGPVCGSRSAARRVGGDDLIVQQM